MKLTVLVLSFMCCFMINSGLLDSSASIFDLPTGIINSVLEVFQNLAKLPGLVFSRLEYDQPIVIKTSLVFKREYDYVIVGGGTAGSVMANRLSQKPCVSILLVEGGDNPSIIDEVPAAARIILGGENDWLYKTQPLKNGGDGQIGNTAIWNSGKGLGGSSIINGMLYVRGNQHNFNNWSNAGAEGWNYTECFPYFLKLEDNQNIDEEDPGYHAVGGPMTVKKPDYNPSIKEAFLKATQELGFQLTDSNGKRQTGIYDQQGTLRNGRRCSTVKAYLVPAEDRPNLTILKNAFATKILIDKNNTAYGVNFDFLGLPRTVQAKQEVIVSVGTIRTPQLLMLSGIGPKEQLEKLNIPVIKDLPVGQNLQDHCTTQLNYVVNDTSLLAKYINPLTTVNFAYNGSGPFASTAQSVLLAFLSGLNTRTTTEDFPRHQLYFAEFNSIDAKNYNLKPWVFNEMYAAYADKAMITCVVSLLQPKSRGNITTNSTDPYASPLIYPNYYDHEDDMKDVVEGMKVCDAMANTTALRKVGATRVPPVLSACKQYVGNQDQYYACYARFVITTIWHHVGTCPMGNPNDPKSVVDPQLRVIGVKGLRIISAAVMPIITSGNTETPTLMIAEKAYDMIKDDVLCNQ